MEQNENGSLSLNSDLKMGLLQIKQYLEKDIHELRKEVERKDIGLKNLREEMHNMQNLMEGNRQLINKLLGDLSKLQNDNDWYKRTYEQRSILGTIRQKIFRK